MSALQVQRMLEVTYNTAWFMCHRIRLAMTPTEEQQKRRLGGRDKPVEIDETYWGNYGKQRHGARGYAHKMKILDRRAGGRQAVVPLAERQREDGGADPQAAHRSEVPRHDRRGCDLQEAEREFRSHESVRHSAKEYVRGDVTTNTVESSFSVVKRGLYGTFHRVSERHLHRYLAEMVSEQGRLGEPNPAGASATQVGSLGAVEGLCRTRA